MLTQKINKKRDRFLTTATIVIVIAIVLVFFRGKIFPSYFKDKENGGDSEESDVLAEAPKSFNADFLKNEKYQGLVDNSVKTKEIDRSKVGNDNPFYIEKKESNKQGVVAK